MIVDVRACGINHLDLWVRRGLPGLDPEMPHILGNDVVGLRHAVTLRRDGTRGRGTALVFERDVISRSVSMAEARITTVVDG